MAILKNGRNKREQGVPETCSKKKKNSMYKFPWTDGKSVGETYFWKNLELYRPKCRFTDVFFTRIVIKAERIPWKRDWVSFKNAIRLND